MHMNPPSMDADGILSGRQVAEGEKIGVVSNYLDFPNGTSYHLHFDIQVFTRDGWLWVNPYTTLISSYERLIRGRGREFGADPPAPPPWRTRCRKVVFAAARSEAARTDCPQASSVISDSAPSARNLTTSISPHSHKRASQDWTLVCQPSIRPAPHRQSSSHP